jgi:hypothetical protein
MKVYLTSISFIVILLCSSSYGLANLLPQISEEELTKIGQRIWHNESARKISGLTTWNPGEEFASMGIGHFIWYPKNSKKIFQESFPELLEFLESQGEILPPFFADKGPCSWVSRDAFLAAFDGPELSSLREFLTRTVGLQVEFIVDRLRRSIPTLYAKFPVERKEKIERQLMRMCKTPQGVFVLVDYLNFKGAGTMPSETYNGKGWGLLQVLEAMEEGEDSQAVAAFVVSAKAILQERVLHAPKERNEGRWLPGWNNRLDSYLREK